MLRVVFFNQSDELWSKNFQPLQNVIAFFADCGGLVVQLLQHEVCVQMKLVQQKIVWGLGRTSFPHGPLLAGDEDIWPTKEDLARQVPAQLTAEGARDGDGLEGELLPARRHVTAAPLALHDEGLAATGSWEHG